jgi:ribosomal protein S18
MFWKSKNSKFKTLIARLIQTTGDCFAYFYFHILTFPFLTNFLISDNKILLYQRNIKGISKKYQRNIKEISKEYQRNIKEISKKYQRNIKETNFYLQKQIIFILCID